MLEKHISAHNVAEKKNNNKIRFLILADSKRVSTKTKPKKQEAYLARPILPN